jgi:hypothetical protein
MVEKLRVFQKTVQQRKTNTSPLTSAELEYFEEKIHEFQHERLIHLIVTMTVGIGTLILMLSTLQFPLIPLIISDGILLILFIAYLIHYRALENGVQKTYDLLDELRKM